MHRQRTLSLRERAMLKLGLVRYCRCDICHGDKWKKHHANKKYITPNLLRPFDEIRHQFEESVYAIKTILDL